MPWKRFGKTERKKLLAVVDNPLRPPDLLYTTLEDRQAKGKGEGGGWTTVVYISGVSSHLSWVDD